MKCRRSPLRTILYHGQRPDYMFPPPNSCLVEPFSHFLLEAICGANLDTQLYSKITPLFASFLFFRHCFRVRIITSQGHVCNVLNCTSTLPMNLARKDARSKVPPIPRPWRSYTLWQRGSFPFNIPSELYYPSASASAQNEKANWQVIY